MANDSGIQRNDMVGYSKPDLSIIIVNWNTNDLLHNCLTSIYSTVRKVSFEIWVVDNASTDNSIKILQSQWPKVHLVLNRVNVGFPKANNQALFQCNGRNVLFLNPDTIIRADALDKMVHFLNLRHDVGAVGPKLLFGDGKIQYSGGRIFPTPWAVFCEITALRKAFPGSRLFDGIWMGYWDHCDNREVECLSGACLMVRRSVLDEIGFLDESLFMYLEDMDLCYRIMLKGAKLYYLAEAEVVHLQGESSKLVKDRYYPNILVYEAYWRFMCRYYGFPRALLFRSLISFGAGLRAGIHLVGSLIYLIRHKPKWLSPSMFVRYLKIHVWSLGLIRTISNSNVEHKI